jgi:capsular exopolysaccharide synthesis family protein
VEVISYLRRVFSRWTTITVVTILGVGIATAITVLTKPVYQTRETFFVSNRNGTTDVAAAMAASLYAQQNVLSYAAVASSEPMANAVIKDLGLDATPATIQGEVDTSVDYGTVLVHLTVTDPSAQRALLIAKSIAKNYNSVLHQVDTANSNGKLPVSVSVLTNPTLPLSPSSPHRTLNIIAGLIAGLLLGIAAAALRDAMDNRIKGPEDLDVPVLGWVPFDKRAAQQPIAFRADPHGTRAEAYRQLRTNLQFVNVDNQPRTIVITSGVPGEGKTTTALNLAAALAEAGYRVCLVEADLRRPTLAKSLGLVGDVGFTTVLVGKISVRDALQNAGRNLAILTSGPVPPNPSELLLSEQAAAVINEVTEHVDYTIIDTAPLLPVADGAEVAALGDATLIVHHAGKSTKDQAKRSIDALTRVGERPVGVILNMMSRRSGDYGNAYGYYYTYRPDRPRRGKAAAAARATAPATAEPAAMVNGAAQHSPVAANGASVHQPHADNDVIFDIDEVESPQGRRGR